jgi:spore cortex formation protein SpoVR/YcgB (stage V sporulation)
VETREREWVWAAGRLGATLRSLRDKLAEVEQEDEIWAIGRSYLSSEEGKLVRLILWEAAQQDVADMPRQTRRHLTPEDLAILFLEKLADGVIFALRAIQHEEVPGAEGA